MRATRAKTTLAAAAIALVAAGIVVLIPEPQPDIERARREAQLEREVAVIRDEVDEAAGELATAVVGLGNAVTELRLGDPGAPDVRLAALERVEEEMSDRLTAARTRAARVTVPGVSDAAREARDAWGAAVEAAAATEEAAAADLAHVRLLAETDAELGAVARAWDEPGARSDQLERLGDAQETTERLTGELSDVPRRPPCSRSVPRRREAATFMAEASERLYDLVLRRDGNGFDALREELSADPYGLGASPWELDSQEADCWRRQGATARAVSAHRAALERLEAALNPPELQVGRG